MIKASIIGATGYAGIELVRLLTMHPMVEIMHITSHSYADDELKDIYPHFIPYDSLVLENLDLAKISSDSDIAFVCLPHGTSSEVVYELLAMGVKVIDLSGEFRYKSLEVFEKWYSYTHPHPELLETSVYGLPELYRDDIKKANLVGNPGCYPTGAILALAPLISEGLICTDSIIIDSKSGTTGAGRSSSVGLNFSEVHENIKAYNVSMHRHTSEIEEKLGLLVGENIALSFTPHLLPIKRGILSTIYGTLTKTLSYDEVFLIYGKYYTNDSFISIYPEGLLPEVKYVNGSNGCHIGFVLDPRTNRIVVISAIDNLIKGAGGQAIQNMNIIFGLDESLGLPKIGWYL